MQAKNKSYCYRNMMHLAEKVVMKEGLTGLWRGVGLSTVRMDRKHQNPSHNSACQPAAMPGTSFFFAQRNRDPPLPPTG